MVFLPTVLPLASKADDRGIRVAAAVPARTGRAKEPSKHVPL
jgi:hypothetical protein